MDNLLSERAKVSRDWDDFFHYNSILCNRSPFDEKINPYGFINFGTAMNNLCKDILEPKLNDMWICDFYSLGYKNYETGTKRLRQAMANFMTEFFKTYEPVSPDNLFCSTGVNSCIDLLCYCLADSGEVFLVPTPMYGRTYMNCMQKSVVDLYPVHVISKDEEEEYPCLTMEKIVSAYNSAIKGEHVVRGILLINPNDPLGEIYSPKLLMDIMRFCRKKALHLIVNEIYALSVFSEMETFHSILRFPNVPDPERIHVLYGLSKDFGMADLRIGFVHTKCKQLQKSLKGLSYFQTIPYPIMETAAEFLENLEWCRDYISRYQRDLGNCYKYSVSFLKNIKIKVRKCDAGCFLWIDLRYLCRSSFDRERKLFNHFLKYARLYVGPGEEFFCVQPGWFRITFAQNPMHLISGLERFKEALRCYES